MNANTCTICGTTNIFYRAKNSEAYCKECLEHVPLEQVLTRMASETRYSDMFVFGMLKPQCSCCKTEISSKKLYIVGRRTNLCEDCVTVIPQEQLV